MDIICLCHQIEKNSCDFFSSFWTEVVECCLRIEIEWNLSLELKTGNQLKPLNLKTIQTKALGMSSLHFTSQK